MKVAPKPEREKERLEVVRSLDLLNTPSEERFDRYARFARLLFNVPIAYVSIIGDDTQWFKSAQGLEIDEVPRDVSICSHTIVAEAPMVVEDTLQDRRFTDNPFVVGPPYMRFYAGLVNPAVSPTTQFDGT